MAQPTEEELLILNAIIYTDGFAELDTEKEKLTVLKWALDFEIDSNHHLWK